MQKISLILSLIAICGVIVLYIFKGSGETNIAYVDNNVLLQKYDGMKKARREFEKLSKTWQSNTDTLIAGWQNELKKYEKERSKMTKKERELQEELLRKRQQEISGYQQAIQKKSQEEEQKLTQTAINEMNEFIKEYGKTHSYRYILGATGQGNLLYAEKVNDITDVVLKGLNEEYKKNYPGTEE